MHHFDRSRRRALSAMGFLALSAAARETSSSRVSVADFGVRPDAHDSGPGVRAAIARLNKQAPSTLHFPPGTYRFAASEGVLMLFDDMNNVTVEGEGATLLFNGIAAPMLMRRCRAPSLKGLTFDWERPPYSQGEVTDVDPNGYWLNLLIDSQFPVDGTERIKQLGTYDRSSRAMTWHGVDDGGSISNVSLIGLQLLHLTCRRPVRFKKGNTVVARHGEGPAVVDFQSCQAISVHDVRIHAGPGIAMAAGGCEGGLFRRVRVEQKPGSERLMSTNADGLHCASCSGKFTVIDCTFAGMGDDGINVTGLYQLAYSTYDPRTLILSGGRYAPSPIWAAPRASDRLLLVSGSTLRPLGEIQVEQVSTTDDGKWIVRLSRDCPSLPGEPTFAIDVQRRTELLVSRCRFPGNRGRGVLAHGDAIIEKSSFEHQSDSAILLAPDMYWQEGPAVERTLIRNNHIDAGNLLQRAAAAVWIGAFVTQDGRQGISAPEIVNTNVAVEENVFARPNGPAIAAAETRDLRIENNRITDASTVAITLHNVRNVRLKRNRCDPPATIQVDRINHSEVGVAANIGLSLEAHD